MSTMLANFVDLLVHFREQRVPHQADMAALTLEMPCTALPVSDVTYVRWDQRFPYIQIIQPVVRHVPVARDADVMAAICRINDAEPLASFALERNQRFIYTRRTLAVYEEGIPATWFERELAAVVKLAARMYAPLKAVVDGASTVT